MKKISPALFSVLIIHTSLSIWGMLRHEVWLDEAHHWLLACKSHSVSELFHNAAYDGHPLLWDLLLYFVSFASKNVLAMQCFHLAITFTSSFLLLRYAPFFLLEKILVLFGYFFFFEYNTISRNYALAWLLLIILSILFSKGRKNYFAIAAVLFLLANTHLFALACSIPFFLFFWTSAIREKKQTWAMLLPI